MFAQLLQNLGSYLDFSKRLATTVPGLVMALALVLLTATMPDWAERPFACGNFQSLTEDWDSAARKLEASATDTLKDRVLHAKESALRRAYYSSVHGGESTPATAQAADAAYQALQNFYTGEGKALLDSRKDLQGEVKAADAALDDADRRLAENRYSSLCGRQFKWTDIANDLLMFGLLGFTLGVVFDPVNKAIFLQKLPQMVATQATNPPQASNPKPAASVCSHAGKPKPTDPETLRTADPKPAKRFQISSLARVLAPKEHAENRNPGHLRYCTAQFYIGKGVITAGEYQDLIDRFYRFCEVTTGLVVPVSLIGVALAQHYRTQHDWIKAVASFLFCLGASIFLARVGVQRYTEFRRAVNDLIEGRMAQIEDAKRQATEVKVDMAQLQMLVHQADRIMDQWFRRRPRGSE